MSSRKYSHLHTATDMSGNKSGKFNHKWSLFYMRVTCCRLTWHINVAQTCSTAWRCTYLHHKWDTQLRAFWQLWLLF